MQDEIRSLDARVSKLTAAVEKSCKAQIASAEWCADTQSDIGTLMAEVREMRRDMRAMAKAVQKLTGLLDGREELKTTASNPVAAGAYDEDIARMTADGASIEEIARWIGCGSATVQRRRRVLGMEGAAHKTRWAAEEDRRLESLARHALNWVEVAENMPGRTVDACRRRGNALGLHVFQRPRKWSEEDDDVLREHWGDASADVHELASRLGRTESAVRNRALRLGLTGGERKRIMAKRTMTAFWARGQ